MINAGSFRKGTSFDIDGTVYVVVDFLHVKPGKGSPFVRTKIKNVMTGQVFDRTFTPTEKFPIANIERKEMQYLYNDGGLYYFMDMETFEQIPFNKSQVTDALNFITENMIAIVQFYKDEAFSVEAPTFVELMITKCELGLQGDTTKAAFKPATVETGYELSVPLFVNQGDKIKIDTRSGDYVERVEKG